LKRVVSPHEAFDRHRRTVPGRRDVALNLLSRSNLIVKLVDEKLSGRIVMPRATG
jgi:hypothetical protein